jgi:hypothetical protein
MKSNFPLLFPLLAILAGFGNLGSLSASTLFWGSKFDDTLVNSSGLSLDASYSFEIGTFVDGFTPTASNTDLWAVNWLVFDTADATDGWNSADQFIDHSVDHSSSSGSTSPTATPGAIFTQGAPAYLWAFNSKDLGTLPEWALLTDNNRGPSNNALNDWVFPDPSLQSGESFDWQTRDLDNAIFGAVNNVQGPGGYSSAPTTFTLQTHVVPEPSSGLFLAVAGCLMVRSRRRP